MLKLDDRITVAFGNNMGIQLSADEVKLMARLLLAKEQKKIAVAVQVLNELFKD